MLPEVNVFCLDSALLDGHEKEAVSLIPASYAVPFTEGRMQKKDCMEKLAAGYMLYRILGISDDGQLIKNTHGKPFLKNRERPYFNLSDDDGMVVLAVSDMEIGVDVHSAGIADEKVIRRQCSQKEYEAFISTPEDQKPLMFARIWTSLEARLKCRGTGFDCDFRRNPEILEPFFVQSILTEGRVVSCAAVHDFVLRVYSLTYSDLRKGVLYDKKI